MFGQPDYYCVYICLFLKNDFKLVLRKRLKAVWIVTAVLLAFEDFAHERKRRQMAGVFHRARAFERQFAAFRNTERGFCQYVGLLCHSIYDRRRDSVVLSYLCSDQAAQDFLLKRNFHGGKIFTPEKGSC